MGILNEILKLDIVYGPRNPIFIEVDIQEDDVDPVEVFAQIEEGLKQVAWCIGVVNMEKYWVVFSRWAR